jgi:hypothetical protein
MYCGSLLRSGDSASAGESAAKCLASPWRDGFARLPVIGVDSPGPLAFHSYSCPLPRLTARLPPT